MTAEQIIAEIEAIAKEAKLLEEKANYFETMMEHYKAERNVARKIADSAMLESDRLRAQCGRLEYELEKYKWQPIDTFDRRMFSIMTTGIPDSCEVVKYKGEVPDWAAMWTSIPPIPRAVEKDNGA